jgi:hypothetical protein
MIALERYMPRSAIASGPAVVAEIAVGGYRQEKPVNPVAPAKLQSINALYPIAVVVLALLEGPVQLGRDPAVVNRPPPYHSSMACHAEDTALSL